MGSTFPGGLSRQKSDSPQCPLALSPTLRRDVKKSSELGKMYGIETSSGGDHPHPVPPSLKPSSRHSSSSQHNSGSIRSGPNSGPIGQKPRSSGPIPKRYTSSSSSFSGSMTPIQPTGLITSGPLCSTAGARSGRLGHLELHSGSASKSTYGSAATSLSEKARYGFRVLRAAMWVFLIVVVMGLLVGEFLMVAVKKAGLFWWLWRGF